MRVGVIGSGAAGLAAARRLQEESDYFQFVVYEQTENIGGTWFYTEQTGTDKYGLPIHTSMYKSLRTNLPKEVMGFPDFPILPNEEKSYIPAEEILKFLNDYSIHFGFHNSIKLNHYVKRVISKDDKWEMTVVDLPNNQELNEKFDAIMVCNGHYHTPLYSEIKGSNSFTGQKIHSHDYRHPEPFRNKNVVVIGAGPSGLDLSIEIASTAKQVILSHHAKEIKHIFPPNVLQKPDVTLIDNSTIYFSDMTAFDADILFYCTGYKYSYPFLDPSCGIKVENNCVMPLFKHLINIKKPTLALIGIPFYVCAFSLFDLQVRFFIKHLKGIIKLPSKQEMLDDTEKEFKKRTENFGLKMKQFHMMADVQGDYYNDLAELGNLDPLPPVLAKLHIESSRRQLENLVGFRNDNYKLLDSNNYVLIEN